MPVKYWDFQVKEKPTFHHNVRAYQRRQDRKLLLSVPTMISNMY